MNSVQAVTTLFLLFLLLVMLRPVAAAAAAMASSNIDEEAGATKADRASHVSAETEELGDVDFAMVLSDVSSFRSSKAKRFLRSGPGGRVSGALFSPPSVSASPSAYVY